MQDQISSAYQLAGEAYLQSGDKENSERLLLYSALIGEADADTLSNLGGILASKGYCHLGVNLLKRALTNQPEHLLQRTSKDLNLLLLQANILRNLFYNFNSTKKLPI